MFVGRIAQDTEIASDALRLLRVPTDVGYEAVLASLSAPDANSAGRLGYREFVLRDVDSRVQRVRVDVSYVEGLLDHARHHPDRTGGPAGETKVTRLASAVLATIVLALGTCFGAPVQAAAARRSAVAAPATSCARWRNGRSRGLDECITRLQEVTAARVQCLQRARTRPPRTPGFGGWFASKPTWNVTGPVGKYYPLRLRRLRLHDLRHRLRRHAHAPRLQDRDHTIANGEFMIATGIVAASNGLREKGLGIRATCGPGPTLSSKSATRRIYKRVFSVFGVSRWRSSVFTCCGGHVRPRCRWRSRRPAGRFSSWSPSPPLPAGRSVGEGRRQHPGSVRSASSTTPSAPSPPNPPAPAAIPSQEHATTSDRQQSELVTRPWRALLYRNWLRGVARICRQRDRQEVRPRAVPRKVIELARHRGDPGVEPSPRQAIISTPSKRDWMKVAEQIKTEDPEAYEYLRGTKGMERIGAGFVAILSAICLRHVRHRRLPACAARISHHPLGCYRRTRAGHGRPAAAGQRRPTPTGECGIAGSLFNIAIFGTGAAVYLFAVDLIMSTASLPGWLQVTLVLLCGVVGWMLLRPYTRITQLSGRSSGAALITARPAAVTTTTATTTVDVSHDGQRNEGRLELEVKEELKTVLQRTEASPAAEGARQRGWTDRRCARDRGGVRGLSSYVGSASNRSADGWRWWLGSASAACSN